MNYRQKFQVAAGVAVVAILLGFGGILYTTVRGASAAAATPTPVVMMVRSADGTRAESGTHGDRPTRRENEWDYSPNRNPSYQKNTNVQQIGYLTMEGGDASAPTILPLFGQSLRYKHSDRWVYFTATDNFQSIRLPVESEKRDCMNDDVGCKELYTGDVVTVPSYNSASFTVTVYKNTF